MGPVGDFLETIFNLIQLKQIYEVTAKRQKIVEKKVVLIYDTNPNYMHYSVEIHQNYHTNEGHF